jgi:hypothetical protein
MIVSLNSQVRITEDEFFTEDRQDIGDIGQLSTKLNS